MWLASEGPSTLWLYKADDLKDFWERFDEENMRCLPDCVVSGFCLRGSYSAGYPKLFILTSFWPW